MIYQDICIIYEDIYGDIQGKDSIILLHGGGNIKHQDKLLNESQKKAEEHPYFSTIKNKNYDLEKICRYALKAYPTLAVAEEKVWINIQRNDEISNLALLPEQTSLLKQFSFPRFINGQAGSGKSTMLQYLFAEICFYKFLDEFEGEPLFLSENQELIENARDEIEEKLKFHHRWADLNLDTTKISKYFSTFKNFLIQNFLDSDEKIQFKEIDKEGNRIYITFSLFKELYANSAIDKSIKRKYSPEIVWYVISTFIKGYHKRENLNEPIKQELTPSEFNALPKRVRSQIDNETFTDIYENIWRPFYKRLTTERGYWDRLDLVRHILNTYETFPKYTVIFCDESQDFARVELQLLIKLSIFTNFDLSTERQVPIALAGDPFQTVNPTGFNLANLKHLFYTELKEELQFNLESENLVTTLDYNYRSSKVIVQFANLIQFFRYNFLNTKELQKPQEAKQKDVSSNPLKFFTLNRSESENQVNLLREKLKYDVIIVPCDEGEEEQYENDGWLSEESIIKSAVRVKGSEYSRVTIYKFGEHFIKEFGQNIIKQLLDGEYESLGASTQFRLSFYFNKLYVAVTRARQELIVLDTQVGIQKFWCIFDDDRFENALRNDRNWSTIKSDEDEVKEKTFEEGQVDDLENADHKRALRNAREDEQKGLSFKDKDKMRSAAKLYKQIGEIINASFCEAKALEFEFKWKKAGDKFKEIERIEEASRCYWIAGDWNRILQLHAKHNTPEYQIRIMVAEMMLKDKLDITKFCQNSELISHALTYKDVAPYISWKISFYEKLSTILKERLSKIKPQNCLMVAEAMKEIDDPLEKITMITPLIASYFYKAEKFDDAIEYWDFIESREHLDYYSAKIQVVDDNKKVYYLDKMGKVHDIISLYEKKQTITDNDSLKTVFESYIKVNNFRKALEVNGINWQEILEMVGIDKDKNRLLLEELARQVTLSDFNKSKYLNNILFDHILKYLRKISDLQPILDWQRKDKKKPSINRMGNGSKPLIVYLDRFSSPHMLTQHETVYSHHLSSLSWRGSR